MKYYIESLKKENIVYKLLTLMIIAIIALFLGRVVKNTLVGLDYPNELLEPANINLTNSILNGNVPYSLDNVVVSGKEEPPVNFEYPFLHSIISAAFSFLFSGNTIIAHYFVSFLSMIGSAILGSVIIFKNSRTTVGATAGFLFLLFCHWRYGYISASPDGVGLFVTILTLYMAWNPNLKHKSLFVAIGTVAAFYSKQYFAFVCISIFLYFLTYSRKEAFKYSVWCTVFLALSVLAINYKWSLFWTYSVLLLMHGSFQGWDVSGLIYVIEQMRYFAVIFVILLAAVIALYVQKNKKQVKSDSEDKSNNPLMLFLIQIPVQTAVLFIFGRNDGAYLTYFLQLLIPSVLISVLLIMENLDVLGYKKLYTCAYSVLVLCVAFFGWNKLPMHMLTEEEVSNWERAYAIVDEYREKGDILHSQVTAYNAIKNGDSVFGTGHDGDIREDTYEVWNNNEINRLLFPNAGLVFEENLSYRKHIVDEISNHNYSLIIMEGNINACLTQEQLEKMGYYQIETIPLQLGNMTYSTGFWVCD